MHVLDRLKHPLEEERHTGSARVWARVNGPSIFRCTYAYGNVNSPARSVLGECPHCWSLSFSPSLPPFFRDENLQLLTRSGTSLLSVRQTHACLLSLPALPPPPRSRATVSFRAGCCPVSLLHFSPFARSRTMHEMRRVDAHDSDLSALLRSLCLHSDTLAHLACTRYRSRRGKSRISAENLGNYSEKARRDGRKHVERYDARRRDAQQRACSLGAIFALGG